MSMEIKGLDKLKKQLEKMEKGAKKLEGEHSIPLDELFTPSFMRKHTSFSSFDELLEAGGFQVESQEDFEEIPDEVFDKHIAKTTRFKSWEDMLQEATSNYVSKTLGL